jgi:mannitol operon repressor
MLVPDDFDGTYKAPHLMLVDANRHTPLLRSRCYLIEGLTGKCRSIGMGLQVPDDFEPWDDSEKLRRVFSEAAARIMRLNRERATAIVAGANLEESLGELLSQFMVEGQESKRLTRDNLRDLGSRIRFAHSFGLVSKHEFKDLDIVRKVRNHFAHERMCSFEDRKVVDLCNNFCIPGQRPDLFDGLSPYETFEAVVLVLSENLSERAWQAKKARCTIPGEIDSRRWEEFWC